MLSCIDGEEPASERPDQEPRPNLILISIDTLRADHLDIYGYERRTAPAISRLAAEGVVFKQAFSQAPKTAPSHMTMLTGLYPEAHGVRNLGEDGNRALSPDIVPLAEILENNGYRTAAIVGGGHVSSQLGFERGFESFVESGWVANRLREAAATVQLLAASGEPFFLFFHTYSVHDPYVPPRDFQVFNSSAYDGAIIGSRRELVERAGEEWSRQHEVYWNAVDPESAADLQRLRDLYDGGILFTDRLLGGFFETLRELDLYESSMIVFVSDHGEEFQDHGGFLHETLYEEILHVPLVIRFPGPRGDGWRGMTTSEIVRLVDLMPTILDYLELEPPRALQGRSFLPVLSRRTESPREVFSQWPRAFQTSLRRSDWKLIQIGSGESERLYELGTDPGETRDVLSQNPDMAAEIRARMTAILNQSQEMRSLVSGGSEVEISPEQRRELQALGYLDTEEEEAPDSRPSQER